MIPFCIALPTWNEPYVRLTVDYVIPSIKAALEEREQVSPVKFMVTTDSQHKAALDAALDGFEVSFKIIQPRAHGVDWSAFKQAHKECIFKTPRGSVAVLLNSDIVVSVETFNVVDRVFADPSKKVIASVGIRALIDGNEPPIGVGADELNRWIWEHKHPITNECIWQGGSSQHPTILFFENGSDVSMHCFHLTPMFVRKDREVHYSGTIDDDMLQNYRDEEIYYVANAECSFAELSRVNKTHPYGRPLTVPAVVDFNGKPRRFRPTHLRNFKQRLKVLGNPVEDKNAEAIIAALSARRSPL